MKEHQSYMWSVSDWRTDELFLILNNHEKGIYRHLLDECWVNGSIPDSPELLCGICYEPLSVMSSIWQKISYKFIPYGPGRVTSKRMEEDRLRLNGIRNKRKHAGQLGGLAKAKQTASKKIAKRSQTQTQTQTADNTEEGSLAHFSKTKNERARTPHFSDDFMKFWDAYPRKIGKQAAWKAWIKLNGGRPELTILIHAVEIQSHSAQWQDPQYIPYASTWLHRGQWDDQIENGICRHRNLNPDLYVAPNEEWERIADKANAPMKAWMEAHKK